MGEKPTPAVLLSAMADAMRPTVSPLSSSSAATTENVREAKRLIWEERQRRFSRSGVLIKAGESYGAS